MQRTKLKAPFGWVGGKTQLARDIIDLIPQDHKTYIEVFGGAGSVLYQKEPSKLEVFNDINSELINLHRAIRNNPQSLSMYLNDLFISREIFDDIKKSVIELIENNDIEQIVITTENIMSGFNKEIGFKIRK